ncbi:energy transducer TonB [Aquabacter sp. P-9]|uniref:energy transducer TonB n=1 Tax=Aquabacter sediminis TaxID=3029197 RepID=UPI00237D55E2|nr:energy transducer TonB [Aquabacter sp. P-9]MDE1566852.1 energy transducer TonB [Aquabacter sp. P-9]
MSAIHWYDGGSGGGRAASRWLLAGAVILAAHVGGVYMAIHWPAPVASDPPAAALMIELAPLPVAPPSEVEDVAPGPQMTQAPDPVKDAPETEEEPEQPPPQPELVEPLEELLPPPPPAALAEALLPPPQPEKKLEETPPPPKPVDKPKPKPKVSRKPPAPATSAAPRSDAAQANAMAAPTSGASASNSVAPANWRSSVMAHINRHKRYPSEARARREEGVARLRFSIDRAGKVLGASLLSSTGSATLDGEVLDMIRRASPLPAPPPEVPGGTITFTVPVNFDQR